MTFAFLSLIIISARPPVKVRESHGKTDAEKATETQRHSAAKGRNQRDKETAPRRHGERKDE
jgi:hypothetical protein